MDFLPFKLFVFSVTWTVVLQSLVRAVYTSGVSWNLTPGHTRVALKTRKTQSMLTVYSVYKVGLKIGLLFA